MDYEIFTRKWLERAERHGSPVDKGDNFIALWIAFNSWMKSRFGEQLKEFELINKVGTQRDFVAVFEELKHVEPLRGFLRTLRTFIVVDMRDEGNRTRDREYDGSFSSLMATIYQIRCNLFHGRKNIDEDQTDIQLVDLAYDILLPLFKEYQVRTTN